MYTHTMYWMYLSHDDPIDNAHFQGGVNTIVTDFLE